MRVAFDAFSLGSPSPNGNNTYSFELINALAGLNAIDHLLLVTYWNRKKRVERLFQHYPACTVLNPFPHPKILGDQLKFLVMSANPIIERFLKSRCDLFHCTNPTSFPFHLPRIATTIHDLVGLRDEPWAQPSSKAFYRRHAEEIMRRSALLFAVSEFTKSEILDRFPFAESKVVVTPLAASPMFRIVEKNRSFLSRYGLVDSERPYLLYVGDIQPRKNVAGIVAAFVSLPERYRGMRLVIVGQVHNHLLSGEIVSTIDSCPARERIVLLHSVGDDDLVLFYNNAEALLYFSFFEGFGLPILEAMQCGCPVVASNTSSMKEIADGAAIMIDPYDSESMRNGIMQVLDDASLRTGVRDAGLERASGYTWGKTAERTLDRYKKVLK
jgi:O-antigen biosynthesis alpha-1,3-mannosyltransferase